MVSVKSISFFFGDDGKGLGSLISLIYLWRGEGGLDESSRVSGFIVSSFLGCEVVFNEVVLL